MPLPSYHQDLRNLLDRWAKAQGNNIDVAAAGTALILFGVQIIDAADGEPELGLSLLIQIAERWADDRLDEYARTFWKKVAAGNLADAHQGIPRFEDLFPRKDSDNP